MKKSISNLFLILLTAFLLLSVTVFKASAQESIAPPVLISPENGLPSIPMTPILIWSSIPNNTGYLCVVSDNSDFNGSLINVVITDTSYQILNNVLNPCTIYYWKVKGLFLGSETDWSETFNFTTLIVPPTSSPLLVSPANNSVNVSPVTSLEWNPVEYATSYTVMISADENFSNSIFDTSVSNLFAQIPPGVLRPATVYYWRVFGSNVSGNGPWCYAFSFTTETSTTGFVSNNTGLPKNFALHNNYPNPFNPTTKLQFELPKNSKVQIIVYDITGKEVKTLVNEFRNAGVHEVQFNAGNLSSGFYFCKMQAGEFTSVKKMVLIK
jgi:hypothetical protein